MFIRIMEQMLHSEHKSKCPLSVNKIDLEHTVCIMDNWPQANFCSCSSCPKNVAHFKVVNSDLKIINLFILLRLSLNLLWYTRFYCPEPAKVLAIENLFNRSIILQVQRYLFILLIFKQTKHIVWIAQNFVWFWNEIKNLLYLPFKVF